jgi:hypothetical protein
MIGRESRGPLPRRAAKACPAGASLVIDEPAATPKLGPLFCHHGMPTIICPECDAAFRDEERFGSHMELEHPRPPRLPFGHRA